MDSFIEQGFSKKQKNTMFKQGGEFMSLTGRWILCVFLAFISILMVVKGIDLWSLGTKVDGDGVGIHLLGLEINDNVPEASIQNYATGFFITSILGILTALALVRKTFVKSSNQ